MGNNPLYEIRDAWQVMAQDTGAELGAGWDGVKHWASPADTVRDTVSALPSFESLPPIPALPTPEVSTVLDVVTDPGILALIQSALTALGPIGMSVGTVLGVAFALYKGIRFGHRKYRELELTGVQQPPKPAAAPLPRKHLAGGGGTP